MSYQFTCKLLSGMQSHACMCTQHLSMEFLDVHVPASCTIFFSVLDEIPV